MSTKELLATVREHKHNCVSAMISGTAMDRFAAETAAKSFLMANYTQVLDIVDDYLTEQLNGRRDGL